VIEKQQYNYDENKMSYTARRTGKFLLSVILLMEEEPSFLSSLKENQNMLDNLYLSNDISIDKEICDLLLEFANKCINN